MILQFLKEPKHIGALCASSKSLGSAMMRNIGITDAEYIAEIGPGGGVFTEKILALKQKEAHFFAIEINSYYARKLQEKFQGIEVENKNANRLPSIMRNRKIKSLDVVISGIPWSLLKDKEQDILLKNIHRSLRVGGYFSTFAYMLPTPKALLFKKKLCKYFSEVTTSDVVWKNLPPAFVYYCKK